MGSEMCIRDRCECTPFPQFGAHRDVALARGAEEASGYDLISAAVKTGSRVAIWLSTRL